MPQQDDQTMKILRRIATDVAGLKKNFGNIATDVAGLKKNVGSVDLNQVLGIVIDLQTDMKDVKGRVVHLEENQGVAYGQMDKFLAILNRHETEIAALRVSYHRLEERLTV